MSAKSLLIIFGLLLAISDLTYGHARCHPNPCGPRTSQTSKRLMVSAKCTLLRLGGGARVVSSFIYRAHFMIRSSFILNSFSF